MSCEDGYCASSNGGGSSLGYGNGVPSTSIYQGEQAESFPFSQGNGYSRALGFSGLYSSDTLAIPVNDQHAEYIRNLIKNYSSGKGNPIFELPKGREFTELQEYAKREFGLPLNYADRNVKTLRQIDTDLKYFDRFVLGFTFVDGEFFVRRNEWDMPYGTTKDQVVRHEAWHNVHPPWQEINVEDHESNTHMREHSPLPANVRVYSRN